MGGLFPVYPSPYRNFGSLARSSKKVCHFFHWTFSILLNVFVVLYMPHFLFSRCVVCLHHFNVYIPTWKVLYSPLKPVIKQKDFSVTCSGFLRSQSVQCNFLGRLRDHEWVVAPLCGRVVRLLRKLRSVQVAQTRACLAQIFVLTARMALGIYLVRNPVNAHARIVSTFLYVCFVSLGAVHSCCYF